MNANEFPTEKLFELIAEEVSRIREALDSIKESINRLEQKHIRIEAECEICRTARAREIEAVTIRLCQLEQWQGDAEHKQERKNRAQWSAAGKVGAAILGVIGALIGAFFSHIAQQP